MKLGLISDVHADINALERALMILESVDHIICAGDLVEKGADGDAVVAKIRESKIACVQGNHDKGARDNVDWVMRYFPPEHPTNMRYFLKEETLTYVDKLPFGLRLNIEGKRIFLGHANPWNQIAYIFPRGEKNLLRNVIREADTDIVILGHTHVSMQVMVDDPQGMILNPGSVSENGSHTCATLSLPDCEFQVYDLATGDVTEFEKNHLTVTPVTG